jgi:putative transport protein
MGLSTDAINRLGLPPIKPRRCSIDAGRLRRDLHVRHGGLGDRDRLLGPKLLGINLEAACKDYEEKHGGGKKEAGGPGTAWTRWALRAYKVQPGGKAAGLRVAEAESLVPDARLFILRIRRGGEIMDATADTVLKEGDVVAVAGEREVLVNILGARGRSRGPRAARRAGGGRRRPGDEQGGRRQDARRAGGATGGARRVPAQDHARRDRHRYPHPAEYRDQSRRLAHPRRPHQDTAATKMLGVADRPTDVTDMAFVGAAIVIGALIGSLVFKVAGVPLTCRPPAAR